MELGLSMASVYRCIKDTGHVNRHNCVYWCSENPHNVMEKNVNKAGVCVWAGMSSEGVIGPFFFDTTVTADKYLAMLKDNVVPLLEGKDLYFMHDGAPAHYSLIVRDFLDERFPDRWIGRRGVIEWPPRSPDLTPPDFFLWGVLKEAVYQTKSQSLEDLKTKISAAFADVTVELCQKVCRSVPVRAEKCIEARGLQLEMF